MKGADNGMTSPQGIQILFFDVGNIFIADDPAACFIYRRLYDLLGGAARFSPAEFFRLRERHVTAGGQLWSFVREMIPDGGFETWRTSVRDELYSRWEEHSPEIPGTADAARALAAHYRLGILANQPDQVEALLRKRGIWDLFEVHAISDRIGAEKPDLRIFQWALERAGVQPADAMMVGDRVDNDVLPAKRLGLRTLWLNLDFDRRGWKPGNPFQEAYANSISVYNISGRRPRSQEEEPDFEARTPGELLEILLPEAVRK
jgi:putative hydrolase of the HAD superfamily